MSDDGFEVKIKLDVLEPGVFARAVAALEDAHVPPFPDGTYRAAGRPHTVRHVIDGKTCLLGARIYEGGVPPCRSRKARKQKNHVSRFLRRETILLRRGLGDVNPEIRRCAREDFRPELAARIYGKPLAWLFIDDVMSDPKKVEEALGSGAALETIDRVTRERR